MAKRRWRVLWLAEPQDAATIFERELFTRYREVSVTELSMEDGDQESFVDRLKQVVSDEAFDLAIVGGAEARDEVMEVLRDASPALPVLLLVTPDEIERVLNAYRFGIDGYVLRNGNEEILRDLLAQQVYQHLSRDLDPPSTPRPMASELLRYAHYYNVLHPFMIFDVNGRLRFVNQATREFLRETVESDGELVIGADLESLPLDIIDVDLQQNIERALAGEETVTEQFFGELDGESGLREVFYSPVYGEAGRVVAASIAVYLPMHPELREARRHAALGRLAASVAHDFNNLLTIVATATTLARRAIGEAAEQTQSTLNKQFDLIEKSVRKGEHLTSSLLAYTGRKPGNVKTVSLEDFLESNRAFCQDLLGEDVTLEVHADKGVPPIEADPNELEQILMNLLGNAREAMPKGGQLEITVRSVQLAAEEEPPADRMHPGEYVTWVVSDNGKGMTAEQLDLAFQPYFTSCNGPRSGLGLATVEGIVRKARGHVTIESEVGSGTTVTIFWPAAEAVAQTESAEEEQPSGGRREPKVLIVEDEEGLRLSLQQLLEPCQFEQIAVESAEDALELLDDIGQIDLLISDVILPGADGAELAKQLRETYPDLQVVLMSGYSDQRINDLDALVAQGYQFVEKPFDPDAFVELIGDLVR